MAATIAGKRLIQTAATRSHVPLIKFPERISLLNRYPMLDKLKDMVIAKSGAAIGIITKPNGIIVETVDVLPEKYRRPRITPEEIDYIEHGGPAD